MSAHQIDHGTAAIIGTTESDSQPWMRILFSYPGACFITGEQAIRNLRAACDAALDGGEMKFRYYITDLNAGAIVGTNDKELADSYAGSEDNFVVDAQSGIWISPYGEKEIKEVRNETHA